jgi:alpha-beta hydrolase superfamily lysophospholipase
VGRALRPIAMHQPSLRSVRPGLLALLIAGLAACGGGADDPANSAQPLQQAMSAPVAAVAIGPGALTSATLLKTVPLADLAAVLDSVPTLGHRARYAVTTYRLTYVTVDGDGREVTASALAAVPVKPAGQRSPVMSWQHGTLFEDFRVPSNNAPLSEPAVLMASMGYITVAADYVGYGSSKGVPHPYLMSAPTAAAVVDLLTAARQWRQAQGVLDNGQLFMSGYSEGGYATMAALRAMEASGSPHLAELVGVAPGAGPYSVTATMDAMLALVRERNDFLRLVAWPGVLRSLSTSTRATLRDLLLREAIPPEADVTLTSTFIDLYLSDDSAALDAVSNVHLWKPTFPVLMFHGRDDRTVGYSVATGTLAAQRARGSVSASLTSCDAGAGVPAGHLECVLPYFTFMLSAAQGAARDL